MVITIDGPAGAGKSSVARALADRLGFRFLDTGAMYRAVTLAALEAGANWDEIGRLVAHLEIEFDDDRVLLNGRDVTREIRSPEVTREVGHAANDPDVRRRLVELQRQIAEARNIVTEGRDQGTVVFPDAECKIYLTASAQERAQRRWEQLRREGFDVPLAEILEEQQQRDERDRNRPVGALVAAEDAVRVVTDGMSAHEVTDRLEQIARQRLREATNDSTRL